MKGYFNRSFIPKEESAKNAHKDEFGTDNIETRSDFEHSEYCMTEIGNIISGIFLVVFISVQVHCKYGSNEITKNCVY